MLLEGNIKPFYFFWQEEDVELGTCKLLQKIKEGELFILDEDYDTLTKVYSYERWRVEVLTVSDIGAKFHKSGDIKNLNIRYLHNIGLNTSEVKHTTYSYDKLIDKFLTVNGVEIF